MAEDHRSYTGSDLRMHDKIPSNSLSEVEMYHRLIHDNKQLIYETKLGLIVVIGSVVIIVCLIYIGIQCKRKSKQIYKSVENRRRFERLKESKNYHESMESLLDSHTLITINNESGKEFFVWSWRLIKAMQLWLRRKIRHVPAVKDNRLICTEYCIRIKCKMEVGKTLSYDGLFPLETSEGNCLSDQTIECINETK